ncbi:MAG: ferritin-like domain-containing protein, partial [Rhodanobacteraceae bacterium]
MSNAPAEAAADHAMRHWQGADSGPIRIGSDAHKRLFCRMLLDSHNPYRPAVMAWPKLDPEALRRITSLPIWDIAVQTEARAMLRAKTYADTVRDPLLREALSMDAGEEARHKVVLGKLAEAYGIPLVPEPEYEA